MHPHGNRTWNSCQSVTRLTVTNPHSILRLLPELMSQTCLYTRHVISQLEQLLDPQGLCSNELITLELYSMNASNQLFRGKVPTMPPPNTYLRQQVNLNEVPEVLHSVRI